jgi:uncharacterized protein YjaZ
MSRLGKLFVSLASFVPLNEAMAITVVYPEPNEYAFSEEERETIQSIADTAERDVRALLPLLSNEIVLEVHEGSDVSPNTGHAAQVVAPGRVSFVMDASRSGGVMPIVQAQLRFALFHELHHTVRGAPQEFMDTVISEGMATVFARDFAGAIVPWADYPDDVTDWVGEIRALEPGFRYDHWMFNHPDGRRWIGYTVGTYLMDQAIAASGRSAAELATARTSEILKLADSR